MSSAFKVAVSGHGTPHPDLIADALRDAFTRYEDSPYRLLVPAIADRLTTGVQAVIEYAWEEEWAVVAVVEKPSFVGIVSDLVTDGADDVMVAPGGDVDAAIVAELAGALPEARLIVMSQEGTFDPATLALARACNHAGIDVFDLSEGMIQISDYELGDDEPEAADVPLPFEEDIEDLPEGEEDVREECLAPTHFVCPLDDLRRVRELAAAAEESVASARDAVRDLSNAFDVMMDESKATTVPTVEAPASTAHAPHAAPTASLRRRHTRTECWDEQTQSWKPRGRGRLKSGVRTRVVPCD